MQVSFCTSSAPKVKVLKYNYEQYRKENPPKLQEDRPPEIVQQYPVSTPTPLPTTPELCATVDVPTNRIVLHSLPSPNGNVHVSQLLNYSC